MFKWFKLTIKDFVDFDLLGSNTRACFRNFVEFKVRIKKVFNPM